MEGEGQNVAAIAREGRCGYVTTPTGEIPSGKSEGKGKNKKPRTPNGERGLLPFYFLGDILAHTRGARNRPPFFHDFGCLSP